jgi:hypothetical protein
VRVIEQSGWHIGYDTFRSVPGSALPGRFNAERHSAPHVVIDD